MVKTVPGGTSSAPRLPDTVVLDVDHGTHALPVSRQTVSLDEHTVETTFLDFVDAQESLQPMSEGDRRHAINSVRKGGYVPLSGLDA